MRFSVALGDDCSIALRTRDTVAEMHELTVKNLPRLRPWEPWAGFEPTIEDTRLYTEEQLVGFARGSVVPVIICNRGMAVGSVSLKLDRYLETAELGYWIDGRAEGRGLVSRACAALLRHAADEGMRRAEIRTGTGNLRSRRVAERLGFVEEGVLAGALPIGNQRLDVVVFGMSLDA